MIKSVYIHIPFCTNICSYCDFCKVIKNDKWIDLYLDSLKYEIDSIYKGEIIDTIYIGGGTPSCLNENQLNKLFEIVKLFKLNKEYEFTFECNIEDIEENKLILLKSNKVNRLSIGVESFNNKYLKYLNRNYKSNIITSKINIAKKYFNNINIDLIYALDGQTKEELESDLNKVLELDIPHVSLYSLIIEENTKLFIDKVKPINEKLDSDMYKLIDEKLSSKYNRYEISNYSKKGFESKANLTYWLNKEYYGFGLSSASYVGDKRYTNTRNLSKYINKEYDRTYETLNENDKIKYELILGFRLIKGINKNEFKDKYNIDILSIKNMKELINKGYIIDDNDYLYVNKEYLYVLNDILVNFI